MVISAPRKSGKSYLIKTMLNHGLKNSFDHIIIICPSLDFNSDYDDFRKYDHFFFKAKVQQNYIDDLFRDMAEAQKEVMRKQRQGNKKSSYNEDEVRMPSMLIIFDDCIDSGVFNFRGGVDKIAERGRHINLSCIISSQRISAISRSIRINSDYFLIFVPYAAREMEQFVEQFVFKDHRKNMVTKLLDIFSTPYEFLLLDNLEKNILNKLKHSNADNFVKNVIKTVSLIN